MRTLWAGAMAKLSGGWEKSGWHCRGLAGLLSIGQRELRNICHDPLLPGNGHAAFVPGRGATEIPVLFELLHFASDLGESPKWN